MKTRWLYYIASVLLAFFAIGHQLGFRKVDPTWHANEVVASMQQTHFTVQGFDRSYWSFFSGCGLGHATENRRIFRSYLSARGFEPVQATFARFRAVRSGQSHQSRTSSP